MNITFIIGNGFDLQNNLKTTFTDFFDHMIETGHMKDTNYIYKKFNESYQGDSNKHVEQWADFEKMLGDLTFDLSDESADMFMDDLEKLREDFINYMEMQQKKFVLKEETSDKILKETYTQFYNNLYEVEARHIKNIIRNYNNIKVNFINFNYTNTLNKLIGMSTSETFKVNSINYTTKPALHIHKTLDTGTFLGVDNREQLNAKIFEDEDLASLIKPESINGYGTFDIDRAKRMINESKFIYIFGMSLGDTDKTWWKIIGDWLTKNVDNRLIINHYHGKGQQYFLRHARQLFKHRKNTENEFIKHLDLNDEEQEKIRERINISIDAEFILNIN